MVTLILPRALESTPVGDKSVWVIKCMTLVPFEPAIMAQGDNITATARPRVNLQTLKFLFPLADEFFTGDVQLIFNMADTMTNATNLCHGVKPYPFELRPKLG